MKEYIARVSGFPDILFCSAMKEKSLKDSVVTISAFKIMLVEDADGIYRPKEIPVDLFGASNDQG